MQNILNAQHTQFPLQIHVKESGDLTDKRILRSELPRFVLAPGGRFGPVDQVTTYRVGHGVPQLPSKYDHGHMGGVNLHREKKDVMHRTEQAVQT